MAQAATAPGPPMQPLQRLEDGALGIRDPLRAERAGYRRDSLTMVRQRHGKAWVPFAGRAWHGASPPRADQATGTRRRLKRTSTS